MLALYDLSAVVDFAAALAFDFGFGLYQQSCCSWPGLPHTQHSPANLIVTWHLESLLPPFLPLPPFPPPFVFDTALMTLSWFMYSHKHLVVRVTAVGVEHKVVGKVTVFFIGTLRQRSENHSALGVFVDVLPRDRVVLPQLFLELVESCNDVVNLKLRIAWCRLKCLLFHFGSYSWVSFRQSWSPQFASTSSTLSMARSFRSIVRTKKSCPSRRSSPGSRSTWLRLWSGSSAIFNNSLYLRWMVPRYASTFSENLVQSSSLPSNSVGFDSSFVSTVLEPLDVPACRVLMRAFNSLFSAFVLAMSSSSAVKRAISVSITIDPSKILVDQPVDRFPLNLYQVGSSFTQTRATPSTSVLSSFRSLPTMSSSRHAGASLWPKEKWCVGRSTTQLRYHEFFTKMCFSWDSQKAVKQFISHAIINQIHTRTVWYTAVEDIFLARCLLPSHRCPAKFCWGPSNVNHVPSGSAFTPVTYEGNVFLIITGSLRWDTAVLDVQERDWAVMGE